MKTPYNEIVNIASIGSQTNPISLNEILRKANDEQLTPAAQKACHFENDIHMIRDLLYSP